jgi:hypothetical protein
VNDVKERVLSLSLERVVEAFAGTRWKFFEVDDEGGVIRLEKPVAAGESYVVELKFKDKQEMELIVDRLFDAEFIEQKRRVTSDW